MQLFNQSNRIAVKSAPVSVSGLTVISWIAHQTGDCTGRNGAGGNNEVSYEAFIDEKTRRRVL
jgi:hypothetical protein